jgi:hypothetical protein
MPTLYAGQPSRPPIFGWCEIQANFLTGMRKSTNLTTKSAELEAVF